MLVQTSLISPKTLILDTITDYRFKMNSNKPRYSTHIQRERVLLYQTYLDEFDEFTFYSAKTTTFPSVNVMVTLEWPFFWGFEV